MAHIFNVRNDDGSSEKLEARSMTDEQLLHVLAMQYMHAGDDFSLVQYTEDDEANTEEVRTEILRRMRACGP